MKIELFVLCDAATDYHGKLNILGTFDSIWSSRMPVVHPQCSVALRLRFNRIEDGEHSIKINIVDEDGVSVIPSLEAGLKVDLSRSADKSTATNMILNIQGLKVEKYGEYSVDLAVDNRHEGSLPLFFKEPPGTAQT